MIEYKEIHNPVAVPLMKEIVKRHAEEVDLYQEYFSLEPNYSIYEMLLDAGTYRLFAAIKDKDVIAYSGYFVDYHPHYKEILYASNDLIYVSPEYRDYNSGEVVRAILSLSEKSLKESGVSVLTLTMKADKPFERLSELCGYNRAEIMYSKYIGEQ